MILTVNCFPFSWRQKQFQLKLISNHVTNIKQISNISTNKICAHSHFYKIWNTKFKNANFWYKIQCRDCHQILIKLVYLYEWNSIYPNNSTNRIENLLISYWIFSCQCIRIKCNVVSWVILILVKFYYSISLEMLQE